MRSELGQFVPRSLAERLWEKVDKTDNCWLWTGVITRGDYGQIWVVDRMRPAHRVAYELVVGPIPEGLTLDHLCRVPRCVNPAHLEPVTSGENSRRSPLTQQGKNVRKTHCIRGHEFTPENTGQQKTGRYCRTCQREHLRRWRASKRTPT